MNHSQIRSLGENVKIFSRKDPKDQVDFKVWKFDGVSLETININPSIIDLGEFYYSVEMTMPTENCYLAILFCGQPTVLRVGVPQTQFILNTFPGLPIDYKHYHEDGVLISSGQLTELSNGFYYYTPVEEDLGYIEVFGEPFVLSLPYSNGNVTVYAAVHIVWDKTVIFRKFGVNSSSQTFKVSEKKISFDVTEVLNKFNIKTDKQTFSQKTDSVKFKIDCGS